MFLHGLALSFEGAGVQLSGLFLEVKKTDGGRDYVGGAVVKVVNLFELSAIGAYTDVPIPGSPGATEASRFIFASLVAPLGGPPWCFITGIAGGFGFNRAMPPPGQVVDHPFIKVMRGEIGFGEGAGAIAEVGAWFLPEQGAYWIAAGIQFNSFGFINGKLIAAVGFGNKFSFNLLGLAEFGFKPLAYFELGIEVTADEERFLPQARLSSNSYIVHPDIFSLKGDLALGVWYAFPHAGDFLMSISGYHPNFERPDHYPELARVGVKCVVIQLRLVRAAIDEEPEARAKEQLSTTTWTGDAAMTGLLIRSELVRRWPDLIVQAYSKVAVEDPDAQADRVPILRTEAISKDVYLALFAGQPRMVHIREPNVGTRYGVEPGPNDTYKVDRREPDCSDSSAAGIGIVFRDAGRRIINLTALAGGFVE